MNRRKNGRRIRILLIAVAASAAAAAAAVFINADLYIRLFQVSGMAADELNTWEEVPAESSAGDGIIRRSGIEYGRKYPNSFLDIYSPEETEGPLPVYVFIHGGGYAWGDKYEGDPLGTTDSSSSGVKGMTENLVKIAESGFAVVSINYALVPEYRYPVPLFQVNQALDFLRKNAGTYGLDMSRIVLSGESAGGQLAGQYAAIVADEKYAEEMKMIPAVTEDEISGVVFRCALLEPVNFDEVDTLYFRIMFHQLKAGYFGRNEDVLRQADVISHVTEDFPPVYITDGNHGTFDAQAKKLKSRLDELHIYNIMNYYSAGEVRLEHGYDSDLGNPYARDNLDRELQFLTAVTDAGIKGSG